MTYFTAHLQSRSLLAVGGAERAAFLQGLITNDVNGLTPERPLYAGLLTPQGKLLYDFLLFAEGEDILIDVAREDAQALAKRLAMYKLRAQVTIAPRADLRVFAAWGEAPLPGLPDPRHSALGTRFIGAAAQTDATEADYTAHRLALGIGEGGEIGRETTYPLEANFEPLHGVSFKKGCYVGQELTARMKHRTDLRKRVLPVAIEGAGEPGTPVTAAERESGVLLAAQAGRGLALLRLDRLAEAAGAPLMAGGARLTVRWPDWIPK